MCRAVVVFARVLLVTAFSSLVIRLGNSAPMTSSIKGKSVDVIFPGATPGFCLNMCVVIKDICNDPDKPVCRFMEKPGCAYRCEQRPVASSVTNILTDRGSSMSSDLLPLVSLLPSPRGRMRLGAPPMARRR